MLDNLGYRGPGGLLRTSKLVRLIRFWLSQIGDPVRAVRGLGGYLRFLSDWYRYNCLPGAESVRLIDTYPQVHDWTRESSIDAHYFYANGWAMRRIIGTHPPWHVDVGSQLIFGNLLASIVPVTFVDYRPLTARIAGLVPITGDIRQLPFADASVPSLSCLHVIEHIGLGRYGDTLDPQGTQIACLELGRVLARDGNLFLAVPVGRPRVCFNAHRILAPEAVVHLFRDLELVECAGIDDEGRYTEDVKPSVFENSEYACALYWFRKGPEYDADLSCHRGHR